MGQLFSTRGCVFHVPMGAGPSGEGFYSVEGLSHGTRSSNIYAPILIKGVPHEDKDIIAPVTTLNGKQIIYRFGKGLGNVSIEGELLLGPGGHTDTYGDLVTFFEENRVAVRDEPVTVSMPGGRGIKVYLQRLSIARVDPNHHTQDFIFVGIKAEPSEAE